jgi:hypothetical protein
MTDLSYMIWFIATGAMTITVLAVGTLAAAELLPRRTRRTRPHRRRPRPHARTGATGPDTSRGGQETPISGQRHHDNEHRAA